MVDRVPTAEEQINFLQNIQRLLEEGKFTSTYKFALLLSLVDLAVEKGDDSFKTDQAALDEALDAIEKEGIDSLIGMDGVVSH